MIPPHGVIRRYPLVAATLLVGAAAGALSFLGLSDVASGVLTTYALSIAAVQLWKMLRRISSTGWGLDVLAVVAIISTSLVGDAWASLIVVLMLTSGQALEAFASRRARSDLTALLARAPTTAHRRNARGRAEDVALSEIEVGDELLVRPGEIVPVDADLLSQTASVDESSLTGESLPVEHERGGRLLSGSVNGDTAISVRAVATVAHSQYQRIVELVESASNSKAPFVRLADRYAVPFTAFALFLGGLAWALSGDPVRFAEVLVVATPCPLLIAAPVAFIAGMSRAARNGIIIKTGGTLEQLARIRTVALDKTGTLTRGAPSVDRIEAFGTASQKRILSLAASAERNSPHILARSIVAVAEARGIQPLEATDIIEVPGQGITAQIGPDTVRVGRASFAGDDDDASRLVLPVLAGEMAVFVGSKGVLLGRIILRDAVRAEAASTITELGSLGVRDIVMVTGDAPATAEHVAREVGITSVQAGLLPVDKVRVVAALPLRPVAMVGDGVNDAPVLAAADIGIALGARGATAASDSADVVILVDDVHRTVVAMRIAQTTIRIAKQSIWIGIGLSIGLMLVASLGVIPAIVGASLQEVVDVVTILNSLRAVRGSRGESWVAERPAPERREMTRTI